MQIATDTSCYVFNLETLLADNRSTAFVMNPLTNSKVRKIEKHRTGDVRRLLKDLKTKCGMQSDFQVDTICIDDLIAADSRYTGRTVSDICHSLFGKRMRHQASGICSSRMPFIGGELETDSAALDALIPLEIYRRYLSNNKTLPVPKTSTTSN